MFIRLIHKISKVLTKYRKINLCLFGAAIFVLLIAFVYSMPNIAEIVSLVLSGMAIIIGLIAIISVFIYDDTKFTQHYDAILACVRFGLILILLAFAIVIEVGIFKGQVQVPFRGVKSPYGI